MAVEEKRNINEDFGNRLREIIEKRKKETGQNLRAVAKDLDVSLGVQIGRASCRERVFRAV